MARGRTAAPKDETGSAKWIRVANIRIRKFDAACHSLEGLASLPDSKYTDGQVDKLEAHINTEIERLINALRNPEEIQEDVNVLFGPEDAAPEDD